MLKLDYLEDLINYLTNNTFKNMYIKVTFYPLKSLTPGMFKQLTDTIFSCLNINDLEVRYLKEDYWTSDFYDKIKNCKSLRRVKFISLHGADAQLETISSNFNIKQSELEFRECDITESIVEKVDELLSEKNDNSVFVHDNEKFKSISKISQIFNISPILDS